MKTLTLLALMSLTLATAAHADTKVTLEQFVDALAKNPVAGLDASEKTTKDPVTFSMNVGNDSISTDADAATFFQAVRAKLPTKTYAGANGISFVNDFGRLSVKSNDPAAPAVYDLEQDVVQSESDPTDPNIGDGSYVSNQYQLLSIVGTIVSYRLSGDSYGAGAAHPNSYDSITSVDVGTIVKNGDSLSYAQPNLGELVDEASLVVALKNDKVLRSKMSAKYRAQLQAARTLQEVGDAASNGLTDSTSCYDLGIYDGKLSNFAIYDYNAAKNLVSVRVTMEAAAHVCAGAAPTLQLGLLVKPRDDMQFALQDQAKQKTGLLMKNAK